MILVKSMVSVSCSSELISYLSTLSPKNPVLLIDARITQEACFFGANPIVTAINELPSEEIVAGKTEIVSSDGSAPIPVLITVTFARYFGEYETLDLVLEGKRKKKIDCKNVKPIIKNVCKRDP